MFGEREKPLKIRVSSHERRNESQTGMDFISVMKSQTGMRFSLEQNLPESK